MLSMIVAAYPRLGTASVPTHYRSRGIDDPLAFRVFMCAPVAALDQQLSLSVFQDCLTLRVVPFLRETVDVESRYISKDMV